MSTTPNPRPGISPATKWEVYEGNVQAYRGLSLSSQALYLAVGAILLETGSPWLVLLMGAFAQATAWWIFFPVIVSRTRIVDYYKYEMPSFVNSEGDLLDTSDPAKSQPLDERAYADTSNRRLREKVHETVGSQLQDQSFQTLRISRQKLDVVLPALICLVWVVFCAYAFLS